MTGYRFLGFKHIAAILLVAVSLVLLSSYNVYQNPMQLIKLQPGVVVAKPAGFFIAGVIDERPAAGLGKIIKTEPGKKAAVISVGIDGGSAALKNYILGSLAIDNKLTPIIYKVNTLTVTETPLPNGRVNGLITIAATFSLQKPDTVVYLTNYKTTATYQRGAGPAQQIEQLVKNALSNSVVYLDNWMRANADNNIKLAKAVKVSFKFHKEKSEGDTIYYDVSRPLKWNDFQAKPPRFSKYGAEVFASLGYGEQTRLDKGVINIEIDLKVYLPKSASWAVEKTSYALNHEQRHFDIVRLVAEHFRKAIQGLQLPVDNYDGPINVAYFDALYELDRLQKQYDAETAHSINRYQQQKWENRLDEELYALGIKQKQQLSSL